MDFGEYFDRHDHGFLQFSGGKDSMSCLFLLRDYWDRLVVVWGNSGDPWKGTIDIMFKVQKLVTDAGGEFVALTSNVHKAIADHGIPSDIVPIQNTSFHKFYEPNDRVKIQSRYECCNRSLFAPLQQYMVDRGASLIIRGTKACDPLKAPKVTHVDGREYLYPVWDWTDEEAIEFLSGLDQLPTHYLTANISTDCKHCTAWWGEYKKGQLALLKSEHPTAYKVVMDRLTYIHNCIMADLGEIGE